MNKEIKDLLSKVILFGIGVFIFFWIYQNPERDDSGNIISEGSLDARDLLAGDCYLEDFEDFVEYGEFSTISSVKAVPCSEPHNNEVFSVFESLPFENRVSQKSTDDMLDMCIESTMSNLQTETWSRADFINFDNEILIVIIFDVLGSELADPNGQFSCVFQNKNNILTTSSVRDLFIK